MSMTFTGSFGTWTVADADLPGKITRGKVGVTQNRRTYNGSLRVYQRWAPKLSWTLTWSMVGTDARNYVGSMYNNSGAITWSFGDGTYTAYTVPGSYSEQESGYQVYDLGLGLEQA